MRCVTGQCKLCVAHELVDGIRPPVPEDTGDPFLPRQGWHHSASNTIEELHLCEALATTVPGWTTLIQTIRVLPDFATHPNLFVCCSSVVSNFFKR